MLLPRLPLSLPRQQLALLLPVLAALLATSAWGKVYPRLYAPLKILILSDIHYGEFEGDIQGSLQDELSSGVTQGLLADENPNFVVVLGDIVTGENLQAQNNPIQYVASMMLPLVARRVNFASTYGNHDVSRNLSREAIFAYEQRLPRSFTQRQTLPSIAGVTNYVLPVFSRAPGQPMVAQLVFLDSNGVTGLGQGNSGDGIDWVTAAQVAFLEGAIKARPGLPTYVFVHIPPPQFQNLQDNFVQNSCVGLHAEPQLSVQGQDQGLWSLLMQYDQVVGVFSGHNHGSGWCCQAQRFAGRRPLGACFARHSGYGGYGDWPKAGRVLLIPAAPRSYKLYSWVRGADSTIIDRYTM